MLFGQWSHEPGRLVALADGAAETGAAGAGAAPVFAAVAAGAARPACGVGLPDVSAVAAAAMTAMTTTAAAIAPVTIAMDVPGPAFCGMARRSRRGRRLD